MRHIPSMSYHIHVELEKSVPFKKFKMSHILFPNVEMKNLWNIIERMENNCYRLAVHVCSLYVMRDQSTELEQIFVIHRGLLTTPLSKL